MANTIQKKKQDIYNAVLKAVQEVYSDITIPSFIVEIPKEKNHGDFATNIALVLAKTLKKAPVLIAQDIIKSIDKESVGAVDVSVAGAGFINFYLDSSYLYNALKEIDEEKDRYGSVNVGNNKKVMIEFVSANPTGPMHMGNARGGALGDTLANVLKLAGYDVTKEFYINDAGAQIDKFGRSLEARYIQLIKGEDSFAFPEDGYMGDDIRVHAQNYINLYGEGLLEVSEEERRQALIDYALELNIKNLKETLEKYRINYDVWFRESTLHESKAVMQTIDKLKEGNITYEQDGALWIKSTEFGAEKDDVLIRQNGIPTYFAADIAYHRNKIETRGFDLCINIWGADHHGHIARMKGALDAIGLNSEKLEVITIQLVRLMRDGQVARMSKRTGKMITLNDLIDEIGIDAARFFFNLRAAGSHMDFDLDLAVAQSSDNPVFYVQYAHARICSIIRILEESGVLVPSIDEVDLSLLKKEEELDLIKYLALLPEEIRTVAETFEPSRLTHYLHDLASLFHSFYNACRVRDEEEAIMKARLKLIDSTRIVIKNVLLLLGVSAPEKM